jgi:hypothetical protein
MERIARKLYETSEIGADPGSPPLSVNPGLTTFDNDWHIHRVEATVGTPVVLSINPG